MIFLNKKRVHRLESLSIFLREEQIAKIEIYVEELKLYNPRLSLVNFKNDEDLFENHILDCLLPLPYFREDTTQNWADVGSGAGLPGLLLAIALEDKHFTLIERSLRRSRFLETMIIRLKLENVIILSENIERVSLSFDAVVFRAFRELKDFVPFLVSLLKKEGSLYAYKGKKEIAQKEENEVKDFFEKTELKELVSSGDKERVLLILTL